MQTYHSKYYTIVSDIYSLNINLNNNDYEFINLPSIEHELSKIIDMSMLDTPLSIGVIMEMLNSLFNDMNARGLIKPKLDRIIITPTIEIDKAHKEKFERYKAVLMRSVSEDFGIDNTHDIKYVVNRLTNLYSKYKNVFALRVCYSDENKSQDRLYSYINKYESGFDNHEELLYNELTGKYILIGLSFRKNDN